MTGEDNWEYYIDPLLLASDDFNCVVLHRRLRQKIADQLTLFESNALLELDRAYPHPTADSMEDSVYKLIDVLETDDELKHRSASRPIASWKAYALPLIVMLRYRSLHRKSKRKRKRKHYSYRHAALVVTRKLRIMGHRTGRDEESQFETTNEAYNRDRDKVLLALFGRAIASGDKEFGEFLEREIKGTTDLL